jgi:hypothetical protein
MRNTKNITRISVKPSISKEILMILLQEEERISNIINNLLGEGIRLYRRRN